MNIAIKRIALAFILGVGSVWAGSFSSNYHLSWKVDAPLASVALTAQLLGQYRLTQMDTGIAINKSDLLPWDRPFAGTYNPSAAFWSDVLLINGAAPLVISIGAWQTGKMSGQAVATQLVMLSELMALQSGINLMVRSIRVWPRPFMWSPNGGEERKEGQASGSFYSGHAGGSFAMAVFTATWFDHEFPESSWSPWIWGGGLTLATGIASLRVAAGKHYPSDVLVGALIGSGLARLILWTHESKDLQVRPLAGGLALDYQF